MEINLMDYKKVITFFKEKKYNCLKPYHIINNNDTIFVSAGIQPILKDYREEKISDCNKIFLPQPVIRSQYLNSVDEGSSIAFINVTSSGFNNSEEEYNRMVKDWYEFLDAVGISSKKITTISDLYEDNWGDLEVSGIRKFHYYKDVEIGDTTFFTKITKDNKNINIDSMSDLGFGLERLRWVSNDKSYFDLYSDSKKIDSNIKAYLSVLSLLTVNDVKPSNKNSGYRARLFSKKLVNLLGGRDLNDEENRYLDECIKYWLEWQDNNINFDKNIIFNEYIRNANRFIIDLLINEGYENLSGININVSRDELNKRLISAGIDKEKVKQLVRK